MLAKLISAVPVVGLAVSAGVLIGVVFVVPLLWPVSIIGVSLTLAIVYRSQSAWTSARFVMLVWLSKSLLALAWVWSTYPIDWLVFPSPLTQLGAIGMYWFSGAVWLALGGGVFGWVLCKVKNATQPRLYIWLVLAPPLWLGCELLGAGLFSIFTLGPDSYIQTYMSFGMTGYLFGFSNVGLALASVVGLYGLTVIWIGLGTLGYYLLAKNKMAIVAVLLCSFIFAGYLIDVMENDSSEPSTKTSLVAINTQFRATDLQTKLGYEKKVTLTTKLVDVALSTNPDYVLLPEDSRYYQSKYLDQKPSWVMAHYKFTHLNTTSILIDSGRQDLPDGTAVLRATIFDGRQSKLYQFDKQYLVPQGEYLPYVYTSFLRLLGYRAAMDSLAKNVSYRRGALEQTSEVPTHIPGVLFCFESVQANRITQLQAMRSIPFVVHPISHAWFHDSQILQQQLDVMLQIQARYNNTSIVSAGNMVQGKLYRADGTMTLGKVIDEGEGYTLREFVF